MNPYLVLILSPFIIQASLIFFDEFYFHYKRGLPLWEKIGHPLDTLTIIACYAFITTHSPNSNNMAIFIVLALFSSLFITKDEFIHNDQCTATEQWLHSVLFVIHPIVLMTLAIYWVSPANVTLILPSDLIIFKQFINTQLIVVSIFFVYQVVYWNISWKKNYLSLRSKTRKTVQVKERVL